jgi:hypothetical protein
VSEPVPDFTWRAQMGFSRSELIRALPRAVEPYRIRNSATNPVEILLDSRIVRLHTGPDGYREIASMRIPQLPVSLEFFDFGAAEYEAFLSRFRKYLQKGGG